ncbi:MAG: methionyl-tRNA formyltransferase [Candidatus Liptonbacteria bacterium]|nr:methionyl-tRNA formyltransferase [Candidatus Liptonbacteria bacterium]
MFLDSKFVFFGTPEFAAVILQKLIGCGFIPTAVVCNPDRPVGRKKIIMPPPVKQIVKNGKLENKIEILQPENPSSLVSHFLSLKPDFFIVAAYAQILPQKLIDVPRLGVIGAHPSLLPKYRGASPIQSAILSGDEETGVTLYLLDDKMDHGPILARRELKNHESRIMNYESLMRMLAKTGGELLVETLPKFLNKEIAPQTQNESKATYTKKFERKDAFVEPEDLLKAEAGTAPEKAIEIERKIRAFNPEPGAWTILKGKQVKLLESELVAGKLKLKQIQIEGEKPKMFHGEF